MARVSWLHDSKRVSQRVGFYIRMSSGCIPRAIRAQSTGKSLWPRVWSIIWPVSIEVQMANSSSVHWPACTLATSWKSHLSLAGLRSGDRGTTLILFVISSLLGEERASLELSKASLSHPIMKTDPNTHTRTHTRTHTHIPISGWQSGALIRCDS